MERKKTKSEANFLRISERVHRRELLWHFFNGQLNEFYWNNMWLKIVFGAFMLVACAMPLCRSDSVVSVNCSSYFLTLTTTTTTKRKLTNTLNWIVQFFYGQFFFISKHTTDGNDQFRALPGGKAYCDHRRWIHSNCVSNSKLEKAIEQSDATHAWWDKRNELFKNLLKLRSSFFGFSFLFDSFFILMEWQLGSLHHYFNSDQNFLKRLDFVVLERQNTQTEVNYSAFSNFD